MIIRAWLHLFLRLVPPRQRQNTNEVPRGDTISASKRKTVQAEVQLLAFCQREVYCPPDFFHREVLLPSWLSSARGFAALLAFASARLKLALRTVSSSHRCSQQQSASGLSVRALTFLKCCLASLTALWCDPQLLVNTWSLRHQMVPPRQKWSLLHQRTLCPKETSQPHQSLNPVLLHPTIFHRTWQWQSSNRAVGRRCEEQAIRLCHR